MIRNLMSSSSKTTSPIWAKEMSTKRNQPYYYNIITKESVWEKPEGCEIIDKTQQTPVKEDIVQPSEEDSDNDDLVKYVKNPEAIKNTVNLSQMARNILEEMVEMKRKELNLKKAKNQNNKDEESKVHKKATTDEVEPRCSRDNRTQDHLEGTNVNFHRKRKLSSSTDPQEHIKRSCIKYDQEQNLISLNRNPNPQDHMKKSCIKYDQEQNVISPNRNQITPRVQNTTSETTTSRISSKTKYVPNRMFDLRSKLIKKRQQQCTTQTCTGGSTSEMEWKETQYQAKEQSSDTVSMVNQRNKSPLNTSPLESVPLYSRMYLVCDTCALLDDCKFFYNLVSRGHYLGIPTVVVIPWTVVKELDKLKTNSDVCQSAREVQRILDCMKNKSSILFQEAKRSREIVESLEICNNDDLVLNCYLQTRKICMENEIAVLITSDINLRIKADTFKQPAYGWDGFRQWARGYKEQHRFSTQHVVEEKKATPVPQFEVPNSTHVYEDEKMDIDLVVDELEPNQDLPTTNIKESCNISSDNSDVPLLQNNLHSHLQELMVDLQAFLHAVLDEALQNLYGDLKHHANNIRLSWTPINYIVETSKRWSMISSHPITPRIRDIFSKIIASVKKYRSAREDFTVADVVSTFSLCEDLANLFAKKYTKSTDIFLTNLQNHREEWEADYKSSLSMLSVDSNSVENDLSIQPVDLALQNIKNCLRTDYEDWKERVESGNASDVDSLTLFYENIANFVVTLKRILGTENPKTFTITSEIVIRLHKAVTCFSDAQGNKFGFDCTVENVLELLQDNSYRKNLEQSLDSFIKLEKQVDGLLDIIDDL